MTNMTQRCSREKTDIYLNWLLSRWRPAATRISRVMVYTLITMLCTISPSPTADRLVADDASADRAPAVDADGDYMYDQAANKFYTPGKSRVQDDTMWVIDLVWKSQESPLSVQDVVTDDLDGDGHADIAVPWYFVDSVYSAGLKIYENVGDNSFTEVWLSGELGWGVITAMTTGNLYGAPSPQLILGHYSHRLHVMAAIDDNVYSTEATIPFSDDLRFRSLAVADTDRNGKNEIIVLKNCSAGVISGAIYIIEEGQVVFTHSKITYFSQLSVGRLDQDIYPEIVVGHGGWGSEQFYLDIYEYDGAAYLWKRTVVEGLKGLPIAVEITDVDLDGQNELLVAGNVGSERRLMIFEAIANDTYELTNEVVMDCGANPMDISTRNIDGGPYPEIVVSTHSSGDMGRIFVYTFDENELRLLHRSGGELPYNDAPFRRIQLCDADKDDHTEVLVATGYLNRAILFEFSNVVLSYICGDINADDEGPNVADLSYLVEYLFFDGTPPPILEAANVDGEGGVNVADLTYLVDYLFFAGPEPICGPIE